MNYIDKEIAYLKALKKDGSLTLVKYLDILDQVAQIKLNIFEWTKEVKRI